MADAETILVVDDNETALYSKTRILQRAGFAVLQAGTGVDAVRMAEEHAPRLVMLDVHLPDIDGWEVCRRLKANPETASILVLQMSATFVSEADTVRSLEGGADGCLTEPVEPPVLVATIKALLRARQAEDALRDALRGEQAARAAAEAANRTKDEFLATLSHELRSPLGAILNWVSVLRTGTLDEARTTRALAAIERNTRLQVKLIEDLLDVSRIISGKMRLDMSLVELSTVVDGALESIRAAADAKGVHIEAMLDPTLGPVLGDPSRLQQVVWNLLSNAVKFTEKGGHVTIETQSLDSDAQMRVSDSGRGIDPEFLPHIFERFRQQDSSSTRTETGLGLGLAIVRHLVELHGGTVGARSDGLGRGTTFTVRLPFPALRLALPKSDRGPALKAHMASLVLPPLAGVTLLVVDDDVDAREPIATVLEQCGANVTTVGSVGEAMQALTRVTPDVIVSDIAMPNEDGFEFIRRVRRLRQANGGKVAALAVTAYGTIEHQQRILAAGYDAFLTKPIDVTELATMVSRLVRAARA